MRQNKEHNLITPLVNTSLIVLLLSCFTSFAAVDIEQEPLSAKKSEELYDHGCFFSGSYIQETDKKNGIDPIISNGSLFFDCYHGIIFDKKEEQTTIEIFTVNSINYQLDHNNIKRLKGVAISLRAKLILSILRSDNEFIDKHFDTNIDDASVITLVPKTKTYKRGLQSISIINSDHIAIKILDKKDMETSMMIKQMVVFDNEDISLNACYELYPDSQVCEVLINPQEFVSLRN